jgi:hypothetical protein
MSRRIKTLIVEPAPSEEFPEGWAVESVGTDPDLPQAEDTHVRKEYEDEQTARLNAQMLYRQIATRPPAFTTAVDPVTNRTVFSREF